MLYLTGKTGSIKIFKIVYILAIATAPFLTLEPIWLMADITNALMIIPNLIALLGLRKVVISETKKFFDREPDLGRLFLCLMIILTNGVFDAEAG